MELHAGGGVTPELDADPDDERDDGDRADQARQHARRPRHRDRLVADDLRLQQDLAPGGMARGRDEHVARPGGEHVGHVEAAGAAQRRWDALLQQHALHELGLRLVHGARDAHELALGIARVDLARAVMAGADRLLDAGHAAVDQRHVAGPAEALVGRMRLPATRADERIGHYRSPRARLPGSTPSSMRYERTSGSASLAFGTPTMSHSTPGQPAAKFTSVCDGYGAERVCEW